MAKFLLKKLAAKSKSKTRRKIFGDRPTGVSVELDSLLKEVATSWRAAFRDKDRERSASLLQLALKAIPRRTGRVSDWLGPKYFNEEIKVERDSLVRVLKSTKWAKFRNAFARTSLGNHHPYTTCTHTIYSHPYQPHTHHHHHHTHTHAHNIHNTHRMSTHTPPTTHTTCIHSMHAHHSCTPLQSPTIILLTITLTITHHSYPIITITTTLTVTGVVTKLGTKKCQIEVRENWGIRVVVRDTAGKEKTVWGQELLRCAKNPHSRDDPYQSKRHHEFNRYPYSYDTYMHVFMHTYHMHTL